MEDLAGGGGIHGPPNNDLIEIRGLGTLEDLVE